jgi:predicted nucleic acid-binding protein
VSLAFAVDSNIAIYAFSKDDKRVAALGLLQAGPKISIQVLNEFTSVSLRKRKSAWPEIEESLDIIAQLATSLRSVSYDVHDLGRVVAQRYKLSFYDSLIISAALLDDCEVLYSEDLQHGMFISEKLTIINPFLTQPVLK